MCKARVKSGTVEVIWPQAPALAKLQRDNGDILMCQSRATSDCLLSVPANVAASASGPLPWHGSGRVQSVEWLTGDVMHFELALPVPMTFDAGQFVVLTAPAITGARAYSMVNYAPATRTLELVIKTFVAGPPPMVDGALRVMIGHGVASSQIRYDKFG